MFIYKMIKFDLKLFIVHVTYVKYQREIEVVHSVLQ
jgi:hypothetical protein